MKTLAVMALATVLAVPARAQTTPAANVTGDWAITVYASEGPIPAILRLKAEGEKLTGTISGGEGGEMPLEGTVKGSEFTFSFMYGDLPVSMSGKVEGDSIKGTFDASGQDGGDWSGKRARTKDQAPSTHQEPRTKNQELTRILAKWGLSG